MIILGIDPNPKDSGYAYWDVGAQRVVTHGLVLNIDLLHILRSGPPICKADRIAIERVRSYGQVLGNETIDTVEWYGGFWRAATVAVDLIPRPTILHEWGVANKSSDKYLKEWFVDHYPALFPDVKRNVKGALSVKGWVDHDLAALAVAIFAADRLKEA